MLGDKYKQALHECDFFEARKVLGVPVLEHVVPGPYVVDECA